MNYKEILIITVASMLGGVLTAIVVEAWVKPAVQTRIDKKAAKKLAATEVKAA